MARQDLKFGVVRGGQPAHHSEWLARHALVRRRCANMNRSADQVSPSMGTNQAFSPQTQRTPPGFVRQCCVPSRHVEPRNSSQGPSPSAHRKVSSHADPLPAHVKSGRSGRLARKLNHDRRRGACAQARACSAGAHQRQRQPPTQSHRRAKSNSHPLKLIPSADSFR